MRQPLGCQCQAFDGVTQALKAYLNRHRQGDQVGTGRLDIGVRIIPTVADGHLGEESLSRELPPETASGENPPAIGGAVIGGRLQPEILALYAGGCGRDSPEPEE